MDQNIKGKCVMKQKNKKKIYVLLTRFPDTGSKWIQAMTGFFYTHASIGLEEDMNTFYSFVEKGFIVEDINRYNKPDRDPFPCQLYELEVSERVYSSAKRIIEYYVRKKEKMSYTRFGLVMSLLRIPIKRKHKFICSQFVAHVLKRAKATRLKKYTVLYLPGDFKKLEELKLVFEGNLQTFIAHFGIEPKPYLA